MNGGVQGAPMGMREPGLLTLRQSLDVNIKAADERLTKLKRLKQLLDQQPDLAEILNLATELNIR